MESIHKIEKYVEGLNKEDFLRDEKTIDAVVRNLEIIGEAANRLPHDFIELHPEIEWRRIIGLQHRIVHNYFRIDLEIIWEIVKVELSPLKRKFVEILNQL